jgi:hypothetical protein
VTPHRWLLPSSRQTLVMRAHVDCSLRAVVDYVRRILSARVFADVPTRADATFPPAPTPVLEEVLRSLCKILGGTLSGMSVLQSLLRVLTSTFARHEAQLRRWRQDDDDDTAERRAVWAYEDETWRLEQLDNALELVSAELRVLSRSITIAHKDENGDTFWRVDEQPPSFVHTPFRVLVAEHKGAWRQRWATKSEQDGPTLKEELLAVAWHPSRAREWCVRPADAWLP